MASLDEVRPTLEAGPSPGKVALRGRVYRTRCCCINIPPPTDPAAACVCNGLPGFVRVRQGYFCLLWHIL